jgi:proline dehydrogenase
MKVPAHSDNYDSSLMERLLLRVARKWVAGRTADEAIAAARAANGRGMSAILNYLGENSTDEKQVSATVGEYLSLMDRIDSENVRGCVSAKPTQLGLAIDYGLCLANYKELAAKAAGLGQFLWIDMESANFTEDTIEIYLEVLGSFKQTGVAMQAYLRRSASDLLHILENGGKVRLVKGAYHEQPDHMFTAREEVDSNFSKLMKMLHDSGNYFAVATHDSRLVDEAMMLSGAKSRLEFQLLMGVRDELKRDLVSRGFLVSEYIPYGDHWLPYSVRRLRERKRNLLLLARSLVQD